MNYAVEVNGARVDVVLEQGGVRLGDQFLPTRLEQLEGTPVHLVRIGDQVHRVAVTPAPGKGCFVLYLGAHRFVVEALDERTRTIRELTATKSGPQGPKPLMAPMPGLIVRLHVAVGDAVELGRPLVSMEAMKMENELRAPSAGTVRAIHVSPGQPVEKGMVLVELA